MHMLKSSLHSSVRFVVSQTRVACCVIFMVNGHATGYTETLCTSCLASCLPDSSSLARAMQRVVEKSLEYYQQAPCTVRIFSIFHTIIVVKSRRFVAKADCMLQKRSAALTMQMQENRMQAR